MNETDKMKIRQLYEEILDTRKLADIELSEFWRALQPDTLLERFAYRKQAGMHGGNKDFIKVKGSKGQIDHSAGTENLKEVNQDLGFKCLHYSVTESAGHVEITILKKSPGVDYTFGVRTKDDSA